jgi:hypothetical protein
MFYLIYEKICNLEILNLWLNYYNNILNINYIIYLENSNSLDNIKKENFYDIVKDKITYSISENYIQLTEYDFLFNYEIIEKNIERNDNIMYLKSTINNDIFNKKILIGKVFYIPITEKPKYTTFEIPDFIVYKHSSHTNYTIDGIRINNGTEIIDNIVCISLKCSTIVSNTEYYENDILINYENKNIENIQNIYNSVAYNLIVNKEKSYGIIWHSMCGYQTIRDYMCKILNINEETLNSHKYHYNVYLQNINIISFVRNPYFRFISVYFDKHVNKSSIYYLNSENYTEYISKTIEDSLENFALYCLEKKLNEYTDLMSNYYYMTYKLKYKLCHIENGLVFELINFLQKYHTDVIEIKNIKDFENYTPDQINNINVNTNYKNYTVTDWIRYKITNNNNFPNYYEILDEEFKELLYRIYEKDFIQFNYDK